MTRWGAMALLCLSLISNLVLSEEIRDYYTEPGIIPSKQTINDIFNESIDPFSGGLQIRHRDIHIPGNGGMDININRVYNHIQTNAYPLQNVMGFGWTMNFGRIVVPKLHKEKICTQNIWSVNTKDNPSVEYPDGGRELLVLDPDFYSNYSLITKSNWKAECVEGQEGMVVHSPNGIKYTMDVFNVYQDEPSWFTSKIEDLNGNWIAIEYDTNPNGFIYITQIFRSEEGEEFPVVKYEYNNLSNDEISLKSISANGQKWEYSYELIDGVQQGKFRQLTQVKRPDNSLWKYTYNGKEPDPDPNDGEDEDGLGSYSLKQIAYPYGMTVDYEYQYIRFDPNAAERTTAIRTKTVNGSNVVGGEWLYEFEPSSEFKLIRGSPFLLDKTTVTGPISIEQYFHQGKGYGSYNGDSYRPISSAIGLLYIHETFDLNQVLMKRKITTWTGRQISGEIFWHGWSLQGVNDPVFDYSLSSEIIQLDNGFDSLDTGTHVTAYREHDSFGNPQKIIEYSNLSGLDSKITEFVYDNDEANWLIGLPLEKAILTNSTGNDPSSSPVGTISFEYDDKGQLLKKNEFGVVTEYTYTPEGDLSSVRDANDNVTRYSLYQRGIATREYLPENVTISRTVNPTGTVSSYTNGKGFTKSFFYDGLNRLARVEYPLNDDVNVGYSVTSEGSQRVLTRGGYIQTDVFNDFGLLQSSERKDAVSGASVITNYSHDSGGRTTFESYPNSLLGTTYEYDALDRIVKKTQPGNTIYEFDYSDHLVTIKNPRNYETKETYWVLGTNIGAKELHLKIDEESIATLIEKDVLGKRLNVFSGLYDGGGNITGKSIEYKYDSRQFLVSLHHSDYAKESYTYDEVGNKTSRQRHFSSETNGTDIVSFEYDELNRLIKTDYDNPSIDDISLSYDENSNVETIQRGESTIAYAYNENDALVAETHSINDSRFPATKIYDIQYEFNNLDYLSAKTYPSGQRVTYSPDNLGRPSQVSEYASSITYFPSGQVESLTFGNGKTATYTQSERLLVESIEVDEIVNLAYSYDQNGNVTSILDRIDSVNNVYMNQSGAYDGLDRLKIAVGSWGTLNYTYNYFNDISSISLQSGSDYIDKQQIYEFNRKLTAETITVNGDISSKITRYYNYDIRGNVTGISKSYIGGPIGALESYAELSTKSNTAAEILYSSLNDENEVEYSYDGNNLRYKVNKINSYETEISIYDYSGDLVYQNNLFECEESDLIKVGKMLLARSVNKYSDRDQDSDGDGVSDCLEDQLGLNKNIAQSFDGDTDGDGLTDEIEISLGSSIFSTDSDGDSLPDLFEYENRSNLTLADSDFNGWSDVWSYAMQSPSIEPNQYQDIYYWPETIVLSSGEAGADIFYTLDGSEPTRESNLYSAPFEIYGPTTVKAIAVKDYHIDSPILTANYEAGSGKAPPKIELPESVSVEQGRELRIPVVAYDLENDPFVLSIYSTELPGEVLLNQDNEVVWVAPRGVIGKYFLTIRATQDDGVVSSATVTVRVLGDTTPPNKPVNLTGNVLSSQSAYLTWENPSNLDEDLNGYYVYSNGQLVGETQKTEYLFTDLEPETAYDFSVVAYDTYLNQSSPSESLLLETDNSTSNLVFRINVFGPEYTDSSGRVWAPNIGENYRGYPSYGGEESDSFLDDFIFDTSSGSSNSPYNPNFIFDVPNGDYALVIHFTNRECNGDLDFCEFDVYVNELGLYSETVNVPLGYTREEYQSNLKYVARRIRPIYVSDGKLEISFISTEGRMGISGLEVIKLGGSDDLSPPTTPDNVSAASYGLDRTVISWKPSIDAETSIFGYRILRNGEEIAQTMSSGYIDTGLDANTSYDYSVIAIDTSDALNESPLSGAVSVTTSGFSVRRINSGGQDYVDSSGRYWESDSDYEGGSGIEYSGVNVSNTEDDQLYSTQREFDQNMGYTFDVPNGTYNLILHFAECNTANFGGSLRYFEVMANGQYPADVIDIFSWSGECTALAIEINSVQVTQDIIELEFQLGVGAAIISGVEIMPSVPGRQNQKPSIVQSIDFTTLVNGKLHLSWAPSSDSDGSVIGYYIYRDGELVGFTTSPSFIDESLIPSTEYSYQIVPVDGETVLYYEDEYYLFDLLDDNPGVPVSDIFTGSLSDVTDNTSPTVPTALMARAISDNQVELTWTESSDDQGNVAGYMVYRNGIKIANIPTNYFVDLGLIPDTTYTYSISAFDDASTPNYSDQVSSSATTRTTDDVTIIFQVNAGGSQFTDSIGKVWYPDGGYNTGNSYNANGVNILNTIDDELYLLQREDIAGGPDLTYAGSIPNGNYTVILYFSETNPAAFGEGLRIFDIYMQDELTVSNLDMYVHAGGENKAFAIAARDVVVENGTISLRFASVVGLPMVAAAEVLMVAPEVDNTPPTVPGNLSGSASASEVNLQWEASTDLGGSVAGYKIYQNGLEIGTTGALSYRVSSLDADTTYTFGVSAYDGAIPANESDRIEVYLTTLTNADFTPPTSPQNLVAQVLSSSSIQMSWDASFDADSAVAGYRIYRDGSLVSTVTDLTYTISGLMPGTTYALEVSAFDSASPSNESGTALVYATTDEGGDVSPPSVPQIEFAIAVSDNQIELVWSESTDTDGQVTGYKVYRDGALVVTTPSTTYVDLGLQPNSTYVYEVTAVDDAASPNESLASNTAVTTMAEDAVTVLFQVNAGGGQYSDSSGKTWYPDGAYNTGSAISVPGVDILNTVDDLLYRSQRLDGSAAPDLTYTGNIPNDNYNVFLYFAEIESNITGPGQRVFDVYLQDQLVLNDVDIYLETGGNNRALVRVIKNVFIANGQISLRFVGVVGDPLVAAAEVIAVESVTDVNPPSSPSGLEATVGTTQITLNWQPASDNEGVVAGYKIYRDGVAITTTSNLTFTDTGLSPATNYSYEVSAFDNATPANESVTALLYTATLSAGDSTPPTTPENLVTQGISDYQVELTWNASTDLDSGVAGYRITRNGTEIATTSNLYFVDIGLSANTSYTYGVTAMDGASPANESTTATAMATTVASSNVTALFRANAGGSSFTDSYGILWYGDGGYNTGSVNDVGSVDISNTTNDALYRVQREDSVGGPNLLYSGGIPNGTYQVVIYFAETEAVAFGEGLRVFDVYLQDQLAIADLDVFKEAGGANKALIRVVKNVNVVDGMIKLEFVGQIGNPMVAGAEVLSVNAPIASSQPHWSLNYVLSDQFNSLHYLFTATAVNKASIDDRYVYQPPLDHQPITSIQLL